MGRKLKIMVSSAVYGFEFQIEQICCLLTDMGYEVINSHIGTVKVHPGLSNLDNCIESVKECDLFFGIIRPYCGTGNIGDKNITFEEMKKAIEMQKPYWFVVHRDVTFARKLCNKIRGFQPEMLLRNNFIDYKSIEMYNMVVKDNQAITKRKGNWAQEFFKVDEIFTYIRTQFGDVDFINSIITSQKS